MTSQRHHISRLRERASGAAAIAPLVFLVVLTGVIISLYTFVVRQVTLHATSEDCIKQAALRCADQLGAITVDDPVFGKIGLCDQYANDGTHRVFSLNYLYATLRLDAIVARKLQLPHMEQLVALDFQRVRQLEQRLRERLSREAASDSKANTSRSALYETAHKIASNTPFGEEQLVDLKLQLGAASPAPFNSGMPGIAEPGESNLLKNGMYVAGVEVPIVANGRASFYPMAGDTELCTPRLFTPAQDDVTPYMVQVQGKFKHFLLKERRWETQTRTSYAVIGTVYAEAPPTVLMISFPHGLPSTLGNLDSLLHSNATGVSKWYQATGGDVPGKGHLADSSVFEDPNMSASQAVQASFYHWLRAQGAEPKIENVQLLVGGYFPAAQPAKESSASDSAGLFVNSVLAKDTGARLFAFKQQSGPDGNGQLALRTVFSGIAGSASFPNSAVPLRVDEQGQCNLAGKSDFDIALVKEFLDSLYATNLASMESLNIAKSISNRLENAIKQTERDINMTNEELSSVGSRLGRATTGSEPADSQRELTVLRKNQKELTQNIESLKNKKKEYERVKARAEAVITNAEYTARVTFDVSSTMSSLGKDGIFRATNPNGFMFGKGLVFVPKASHVTEEEIYRLPEKTDDSSSWVSERFNVMQHTRADTTVDGHPIKDLDSLRAVKPVSPRFVLFDSRSLSGNFVQPTVLSRSPFGDSGISHGELSYYQPDTLQTGANPAVGWSLLIRDLCARAQPGLPLGVSSLAHWCNSDQFALSACPNLGVEVQVRAPVPLIPDLPVGSSVENPSTHERSSEIPPMPASML